MKGSQKGKDQNPLLAQLRQSPCPHCKRRFRIQDLRVIDEDANLVVVERRCHVCDKRSLTLISIGKIRAETHYCDLDAEEWMFYKDLPPVMYDDVISCHRVMREYSGDLSDVLEDPVLGPNSKDGPEDDPKPDSPAI